MAKTSEQHMTSSYNFQKILMTFKKCQERSAIFLNLPKFGLLSGQSDHNHLFYAMVLKSLGT